MNKNRGLDKAVILLGLAGGLFACYFLYDLYTFQARTGKSPEMGWLLAIFYIPMGCATQKLHPASIWQRCWHKGFMSAEYEGEESPSTGVPKLIDKSKTFCRKYSSV
jgi:hypothetical protein